MRLPNAERARVDREKLTDCLLCVSHPDGGSKAEFFARFGFRVEDWEVLAEALRRHGFIAMSSTQWIRHTVSDASASGAGGERTASSVSRPQRRGSRRMRVRIVASSRAISSSLGGGTRLEVTPDGRVPGGYPTDSTMSSGIFL